VYRRGEGESKQNRRQHFLRRGISKDMGEFFRGKEVKNEKYLHT
jgi:hypothetical protein